MRVSRCFLAGMAQGVFIILSSLLFNGVIFIDLHRSLPFFRSGETWHFFPGMAISTLVWGVLLAGGFAVFYRSIPGTGLKKGLNYGLIMWAIFFPFVEFFNYLQFKMPFTLALVGMGLNLVALSVGGVLMAKVYGKSLDKRLSPANRVLS